MTCVCACERERERERKRLKFGIKWERRQFEKSDWHFVNVWKCFEKKTQLCIILSLHTLIMSQLKFGIFFYSPKSLHSTWNYRRLIYKRTIHSPTPHAFSFILICQQQRVHTFLLFEISLLLLHSPLTSWSHMRQPGSGHLPCVLLCSGYLQGLHQMSVWVSS